MLLICSCSPGKKLQKGQYLLNKNIIRSNNYKLSHDELYSYLKPVPNRKILGIIKLNYLIFRLADRGKENKFKNWLKNTVGEPPVILDSNQVFNSMKQLNIYLCNKGYFNSDISNNIKLKKHKANVYYFIKTVKPYSYRNISYSSYDSLLLHFIINDSINSLIKKNEIYDVDVIEHERDRITYYLKNKGYYMFSKEYIYFKIDSSLGTKKMDVEINVKQILEPVKEFPDSIIPLNHKQYRINNVFLFPDYSISQKDSSRLDTLSYQITPKSPSSYNPTYYLIYKDRLKFKPATLTKTVFIKKNSLFSISDLQETYSSISVLQNFKFININFSEIKNPNDSNLLNCNIRLTRLPKQSFTIATEGTNSGGDLGVASDFGYQNINLFKGAEIFSIRYKMALEAQKIIKSEKTQNIVKPIRLFNTLETGVETNLEIPKFLVPLPQESFAQASRPKTNINIGFTFQRRTDFTRIITNMSYGYKWRESIKKTHIIIPIDINTVKIKMDSSFEALINSFKDKMLLNSYTNHLTGGLKYSYIFNSQDVNKLKDFTYFRLNLKTAGNFLRVLDEKIIKGDYQKGYYTLANIRYAQFIRIDADIRFYDIINQFNSIIYRGAVGFGIPYLNLTSLPFEESFFCGGANGIRAWEIRSLGPGGYFDPSGTMFDKTGEIKIEGNIEYRFPIYKLFKGAAFIDAGNVWLKDKNPNLINGEFKIERFFKEIAIGGGLGARLDFSFFIIRADAAVPFKNPAKPVGKRWVLKNSKMQDFIVNLGIGYPF